jgi:putative ABC transport system permease protein
MRHAARRLARSPAFTIASILTLALAIGANTAIFAVVERVLLNPLPYPESDRLVDLDHGASTSSGRRLAGGIQMSAGLYYLYLDRARTIEGISLYRTAEHTLTDSGEPERVRIARVTPSLAAVIRVSPVAGCWFTPNEGAFAPIVTPAMPAVFQTAVVSHRLWMRRYGGDRALVSRTISLDGVPTEIVGIMPAQFEFPDRRVDIWIPEQVRREPVWDTFMHSGIARLRGSATVDDARRELSGLIADLPNVYPNDPGVRGFLHNVGLYSATRTLKEAIVGRVANALWIVLASVGVVLLIACANVANLFLVRSESRQRDIAVRRALGAGRFDIARYFLAESVWLGAGGAATGLLLAAGGIGLLVRYGPESLPRLGEVRLDAISVAFNLAVAAIAVVLFGTMPLLRPAVLTRVLQRGARTIAGTGGHAVRHTLMAAQIALALVLLNASGLLVRSFEALRNVDPAFNPRSALTFKMGLPANAYPRQPSIAVAHQTVLDGMSALPGAAGVAAATCLPLAEEGNGNLFTSIMRVQGRVVPPGTIPPPVGFCAISAKYFETMGTPLIRGRSIEPDDVDRHQPVAVVNQALASAYFGAEDPIGQHVTIGPPRNTTWLTIVGVVRNTPVRAIGETRTMGQLFLPMSLARSDGLPVAPDAAVMNYVVRATTEPLSLLPAVRRVIRTVDQNVALSQTRTLQDLVDRSAAQAAFTMTLLAMAAAIALLLGTIGIYGVTAYVVTQRTAEIGVRLALGAAPRDVAAMIVRQGGIVAVAGAGVGLAIAFTSAAAMSSLLYGVSPRDPAVLTATTAASLIVALLSSCVPAIRAARLNPLDALRAD